MILGSGYYSSLTNAGPPVLADDEMCRLAEGTGTGRRHDPERCPLHRDFLAYIATIATTYQSYETRPQAAACGNLPPKVAEASMQSKTS